MSGPPIYVASELVKTWRLGRRTVTGLHNVDFDLNPSEYVVIQGRSGSGKSTLLQVLAGLERPDRGQLRFRGEDLARASDRVITRLRRQSFGFVFQAFNLIPTLTAAENIEAALAPVGRPASFRRGRSAQLLEQVGLAERHRHLPSELSGGEQQRVAIARAIANEPEILFADEPTGNLDSRSATIVLEVIRGLAMDNHMSIVVVTHDADVARDADRALTMSDGRLVA